MKRIKAFSLFEMSVVLVVISLMLLGMIQSTKMIKKYKLAYARLQTQSSPVPGIKGLEVWYETTMETAFASDAAGTITAKGKNGNAITTWVDQSSQNTTRINVTQSTTDNQPIFTDNAINGLPALLFDGSNDTLISSNSEDLDLKSTSSQITIFLVLKSNVSGSANMVPISKTLGSGTYSGWIFYHTSGVNEFRTDINANVSNNNSIIRRTTGVSLSKNPTVVSSTYNGIILSDGIKIFKNGQDVTDSPTSNVIANSPSNIGYFRISGVRSDTSIYNGYIAEVIVYNRCLETKERQAVERYLGKKWGISVAS